MGSRLFGIPSNAAFIILAILTGIHIVVGGSSGLIAWEVGHLLHNRLRGAESSI